MKITKRQLQKIIKEVYHETSPEEGEIYGHGGKSRMAKSQLYHIALNSAELHDLLDEEDELPEWVQSKLAVVKHSMDAVLDHIKYKNVKHSMDEIEIDEIID